jgi:hypothetical protein
MDAANAAGERMDTVADFGIITAANDRMLPFLEAWFGAVRTFNPDVPLAVLPFDDESEAVRQTAERGGMLFCDDVTARWRALGRAVYPDAEYRPGTPSANYLSKMAAFDGPFARFLFLDCNSMIFFDATTLPEKTYSDVIYFLYSAKMGSNYAREAVASYYRRFDPEFRYGFNANFFLSSRHRISLDTALAAVEDPARELARLFGPAPEQSFVSWYCARFGVPCVFARDVRLGVRGWARAELGGLPEAPVNPGGQRVHHVKWNGPRFAPDLKNYWLLAHYRPIGQALLA